jgi:hypothetical protein
VDLTADVNASVPVYVCSPSQQNQSMYQRDDGSHALYDAAGRWAEAGRVPCRQQAAIFRAQPSEPKGVRVAALCFAACASCSARRCA